MVKDSEICKILNWILLLIIISLVGIIMINRAEIRHYKRQFQGTVQECFDKGGDTFYANKKRGRISCSTESKYIDMDESENK